MALADLIRTGIAIANQQTAGTQVPLWHWPALERNEFGKVTFDLAVERSGIVEQKSRAFRGVDGKERVSETKVTLLSAVTVTDDDAFALVDQSVANASAPVEPENTMGQILNVDSLLGPDRQPYMVEIWMGRATGQ